jgi:hypothetical protein
LINVLPWSSSITKHTISYANELAKDNDVLLVLKDEPVWQDMSVISERVQSLYVETFKTTDLRNVYSVHRILREIKDFNPEVVDIRGGYPWMIFLFPMLRKYPLISAFVTSNPRVGEKELLHYKLYSYITKNISPI